MMFYLDRYTLNLPLKNGTALQTPTASCWLSCPIASCSRVPGRAITTIATVRTNKYDTPPYRNASRGTRHVLLKLTAAAKVQRCALISGQLSQPCKTFTIVDYSKRERKVAICKRYFSSNKLTSSSLCCLLYYIVITFSVRKAALLGKMYAVWGHGDCNTDRHTKHL